MKKRMFIFELLLIILLFMIYVFNSRNNYIDDNMITNYSISKLLVEQEKINDEIKNISNSNKYNFDNPKVMVNPFKISPLTALIIFNTDVDTSINVNVNNEYYFETEVSTNHLIPIYGLYENKRNIVTLKQRNMDEKIIEIITDKSSNINELNVIKTRSGCVNDLYFMTSPVGTSASAYDKNGNLKWYLTEKFTMDFEWLDNGHFLVGIKESDVSDRKIGFVEMDYLGKIYNYYVLEHGYEFEFQALKNGNYMLCGGDSAIFYDKAWIYEIDKNGNVVSHLDLYDVFTSVNPDFDKSKLNYKMIRNAFYYNEDTKEIVISLRGLNSVVSINYETKEINYIFAPKGIYSDKFDKYMVDLKSGRYPLGIHSVFMTEDGYIGFINNGYDRFNGFEVGGIDDVSHYKDCYSSVELYDIKDKKANLVWSFDADKKLFTHQYGSFNIYGNTKLINFGWTLKDEYRKKEDATLSESEKNTDNTYAKIFEINEDDEIIFEATIEDGKYRIFKHSLYLDTIDDFDYSSCNFYNTMSISNIETIKTKSIEDKLNKAYLFENNITFTKYSLDTDFIFDTYDSVEILLVDNNNSYKLKYKEENKNVIKNLNIDLKKGEYALYLIINDIYFKTNVKVVY